MKTKPVLIILGSLIIFVLILIWVYLLFFGAPKDSQEILTKLTGGEEEIIDENQLEDELPESGVNTPKLQQLTTREVAGYREVNPTTNPAIYYVEKGTGHIYSINSATNENDRIPGATIPGVTSAAISPQGDYMAVGVKSNTKNTDVMIGQIANNADGDTSIKNLNVAVDQFSISDSEELLYTTRGDRGLIGHSYKFDSGLIKNIFEIPFHEAVVQWGSHSNDTHYFYPKPSRLLEGYLYEVNSDKISRLPIDGFGLTALVSKNYITYTNFSGVNSTGLVYDTETKTSKVISILPIPEKCSSLTDTDLICAFDKNQTAADFPDNWYQGVANFKDSLWQTNLTDASTKLLINTEDVSKRHIDVTNLTIDHERNTVYFINKNDNTLWKYEI